MSVIEWKKEDLEGSIKFLRYKKNEAY